MTFWSSSSSHWLKFDPPKLRNYAWKDKVGWGREGHKNPLLNTGWGTKECVHRWTNLIPLSRQRSKWNMATFKVTYKCRAFSNFVLVFSTFACIPLFCIYVGFTPFWPDREFPLPLFNGTSLCITTKRVLTGNRGGGGEVSFNYTSESKC